MTASPNYFYLDGQKLVATDNGDGTITDNVTGLMWQKTDAGEMTWENAVNNASTQST